MSLPLLSNPRTRILLLASSFEDAVIGHGTDTDGRGSRHGSSAQGPNPELWPYGSYREFQRALETLRQSAFRPWVRCFEQVYVMNGSRLVRNERGTVKGFRRYKVGAPRKGTTPVKGERQSTIGYLVIEPFDISTVVRADALLDELVKRMPSQVFVPAAVSENAGYSQQEARTFERRRSA